MEVMEQAFYFLMHKFKVSIAVASIKRRLQIVVFVHISKMMADILYPVFIIMPTKPTKLLN